MKVGPRYKICKRLGNGVFEKCQTQKFTLSEARRSMRRGRRPRALSDYGKQLLEKQRVRFTYGVTEKQFSKYVRLAEQKSGDRTAHLLVLLETRLDNIVYRLGFARTRRAARQFVAHGHFLVNGKKATIPSFTVQTGDIVSLREKSKTSIIFTSLADETLDKTIPGWLSSDSKKVEGSLKQYPTKETVDVMFDLSTVMEYYSR